MTVTLAIALLLQAIAVTLLRHRLGAGWLRRPAVILVIISVVYDGVTQLMLLAPSLAEQDTYRAGVAAPFVAEANLVLSACMLAFAVAYLLTRPERAAPGLRPAGPDPVAPDRALLARTLDWRLLAAADLPLALLTYAGRGYNQNGPVGPGSALSSELAVSFFLLLTVLAAAGIGLRYGPRWVLAALIGQSAVLAAAGERTPLIACGVALMLVLSWAGIRLPRAQLAAGAALVAVAVLAVTGSRVTHGRQLFYADSGAGSRMSALSSGLSAAGSSGDLAAQAAIRLDGVSFTAAVLQAESRGQPRLPAWFVPASLLEAVPSVLWPAKLDHTGALSPAQLQIDSDGLQQTNFLPGLPGTYSGFLPAAGLTGLLALLGLLAGAGERRLLARCTPARLVLLAGAALAAMEFEAGLPAMVVALRSAVAVAVAVRVAAAVAARLASRRGEAAPAGVTAAGTGPPAG